MPEEETRERILDAATEIFADQGYTGATTRAIAARAGVNEVTLFRHFGSKRSLFQAMVERNSALPLLEKALQSELTGDLRRDLTTIATSILTMMIQRHREILMSLVEAERQPEMQPVITFIPSQLRKALAGLLQQHMRQGTVRPVDPLVAAQALLGMLLAFSISIGTGTLPEGLAQQPAEQVAAQFVDIFLQGIALESRHER